jgi:hypothetical protein
MVMPAWQSAIRTRAGSRWHRRQLLVALLLGVGLVLLAGAPAASAAEVEVVTSDADDGAGSLRQAIRDVTDGGRIEFEEDLEGSIELESEIEIEKPLTIEGPGADVLSVTGEEETRLFNINVSGSQGVEISRLALTDGAVAEEGDVAGGAVFKDGNAPLTITESRITHSSAASLEPSGGTALGGGVAVAGGRLVMTGVTVDENYAFSDDGSGSGGGLALFDDALGATLTNVTVSGNHADGADDADPSRGGGIAIMDPLPEASVLRNVTVAANDADEGGGLSVGGDTRLINSLIANNFLGSDCGIENEAEVETLGANLIEDPGDCATGDEAGVITGVDAALEPLDDYGGPTPTHALREDSPAINKAPVGPVRMRVHHPVSISAG